MVGRGSLIVILGFSIIFGIASQYWNRTSNRAMENFVNYYDSTVAHNIAVSAANLACDSIFQNSKDTAMAALTGGFPVPGGSNNGTYKIVIQMQPGNWGARNAFITATGSYAGLRGYTITDTVKILLSPYAFSRFAFFTNTDNGVYWITGDTLTGPYQTNGTMNIQGVPVIKGPASAFNGTNPATLPDKNGDTLKADSFRSGVSVPLPSNITATAAAAIQASTFSNSSYTGSSYAYDVYLTFNSNGTVTETDTTRKYTSSRYGSGSWSTVASTASQNIALSSMVNSSGQVVILVNDGDVHVSGTVNGSVTVVAQEPTSNNRISSTNTSNQYFSSSDDGNVLINGNITYQNNPQTSPGSTNMLGLVASNDVMLTTQPNGDVTIDAAIFALNGSFTYQDYSVNSNNGNFKGYLNVYGSITQQSRGAVGMVGGNGYLKDYKYDTRFAYVSPPAFPGTNQYRVIAWRE